MRGGCQERPLVAEPVAPGSIWHRARFCGHHMRGENLSSTWRLTEFPKQASRERRNHQGRCCGTLWSKCLFISLPSALCAQVSASSVPVATSGGAEGAPLTGTEASIGGHLTLCVWHRSCRSSSLNEIISTCIVHMRPERRVRIQFSIAAAVEGVLRSGKKNNVALSSALSRLLSFFLFHCHLLSFALYAKKRLAFS